MFEPNLAFAFLLCLMLVMVESRKENRFIPFLFLLFIPFCGIQWILLTDPLESNFMLVGVVLTLVYTIPYLYYSMKKNDE